MAFYDANFDDGRERTIWGPRRDHREPSVGQRDAETGYVPECNHLHHCQGCGDLISCESADCGLEACPWCGTAVAREEHDG